MGFPQKENIVCQLGAGSPWAVHRTAASIGRTSVTEKSLAGFAAAFSKALFQGASLTFGNFPFQLGQQWRSTATRREIMLDLFVPRLPVTLAQPTR